MPTLAEIHDADMGIILDDCGVTFTYSGTDYACTADEKASRKELQEGGFLEDFDLIIKTRAALFDTLPTPGQKITYDSQEFRIQEVRKNFSGKLLTLRCMTVNK